MISRSGNNNLTGEIPSELGLISTLEGLHLCENNLQGTVPDEIVAIVTLIELDLCHNQLTGSIPSSVFSASKGSRLLSSSLQALNLGKSNYFVYVVDKMLYDSKSWLRCTRTYCHHVL